MRKPILKSELDHGITCNVAIIQIARKNLTTYVLGIFGDIFEVAMLIFLNAQYYKHNIKQYYKKLIMLEPE